MEKQKGQDGEANVTTVLFDDRYELIHDHFLIRAVRPLTGQEYYVRGATALLDAVGKTIHKLGNVQKYLPDELRAEKVIFVIITDGLENASRTYDYVSGADQANDRTAEGTLRLGVPVLGRQHGRGQRGRKTWHQGRQSRSL